MTTNVPQVQFTPEGVVLPEESEILAGVFADLDTAFGGGLNQDKRTLRDSLRKVRLPSSEIKTTR